MATDADAAEACKQLKEAFAKSVPHKFGDKMVLFRVGQYKAWVEFRRFRAPKGKLAFITSDIQHQESLVAGRSPVQSIGTNRQDSAAITVPPEAKLDLVFEMDSRPANTKVFSATNILSLSFTNSSAEPGFYWLTWRPGVLASGRKNGWEIFVNDAKTLELLKQFSFLGPPELKWRTDLYYQSATADPGETIEKVLLISDGMVAPGNSPLPDAILRVKMVMQRALPLQVAPEPAAARNP